MASKKTSKKAVSHAPAVPSKVYVIFRPDEGGFGNSAFEAYDVEGFVFTKKEAKLLCKQLNDELDIDECECANRFDWTVIDRAKVKLARALR